jgi:hypothetical protein
MKSENFLICIAAILFATEVLSNNEYEIHATSGENGELLAGTMWGFRNDWKCNFSTSLDFGENWNNFLYKNEDFDLGGNPTVAIDGTGTMYAVCMSANLDYRSGVLEISRSLNHGLTWSQWTRIPTSSGLPDKPWIVAQGDGGLALSYSRIERSNQGFQITVELTR